MRNAADVRITVEADRPADFGCVGGRVAKRPEHLGQHRQTSVAELEADECERQVEALAVRLEALGPERNARALSQRG